MAATLRIVGALLLMGLVILTVEGVKPAATPRGRFPGGPYEQQTCGPWCYDSYQGLPGAYPPYQQPYPYQPPYGFGFNQYSAKKKPNSG